MIAHTELKPFGIEIDADPKRGFTSAEKDELRRLYAKDGLVVFRNLKLTMDEQLDLCEIFGPVMRGSEENYLVSNVHHDGLLGNRELQFHNDVPYVPEPYIGGSLHAVDVAPGVSATRFANGLRAYERMPQKLRDRIENLNALHCMERVPTRPNRLTDMQPGDLCTLHPVVGRQKGTNRPYLFVNQAMAALIVGLSEPESDKLLDELFSYLYADGAIYEHAWHNGDIVIWDNLAVQHARKALSNEVRTLQRVTIAKTTYVSQHPSQNKVYEYLRTFEKPAA